MEIERRGALRDDGMSSIKVALERLRWNDAAECLTAICDNRVRNFTGNARHMYKVHYTLEEISQMVKFVGENCREIDKEKFSKAFQPILPALNKIIARASGIY